MTKKARTPKTRNKKLDVKVQNVRALNDVKLDSAGGGALAPTTLPGCVQTISREIR